MKPTAAGRLTVDIFMALALLFAIGNQNILPKFKTNAWRKISRHFIIQLSVITQFLLVFPHHRKSLLKYP